jgi:hypothetical protein
MSFSLMVIDYFNFKDVSAVPKKAYSPLVVNPDTVSTLSVTRQFFQLVSRRHPQIVQLFRSVQD